MFVSTALWTACSGESQVTVDPLLEDNPLPEAGSQPPIGDKPPGVEPDADPPPRDAGSDAYAPDPKLGLSKGCERTQGATGFQQDLKVTIAGVERTYDRFIPTSYEPKKPMMLVVALHGSGGTKTIARNSFDLEAEGNGQAIFIYPQALPFDPNFEGENRWNTEKDSFDYEFFDAIVAKAGETHCINRDRLFVVGFSLGARFGAMLGCYRGKVIRALGLAAPGGDEKTLPLSGCAGEVALWEGLGTKDDDLHTGGATLVREHYLAANACAATKKEVPPQGCAAYDGCRTGTGVTFCSYDLDHAWPPIGPVGTMNFFKSYK